MKPGSWKHRLSITLAAILLFAVVTSPLTTLFVIWKQARDIVSDSMRGLASSSLATIHVSEGFLDTAVAVNGSESAPEDLVEALDESSSLVDEQFDRHRETLRSENERKIFAKMTASREDYRSSRREVVELVMAGERDRAAELFRNTCVPQFEHYATALGDVVESNAAEARQRGAKIIRYSYVLFGVQLVLLLFFFIYGFFVPLTAILERLTRRPVTVRK